MKDKTILYLTILFTITFLFGCSPKDNNWKINSSLQSNSDKILQKDIATVPPSHINIAPEVLSGEQFLESIEAKVFDEINAERELNGLDKLFFDIELEVSARTRSMELCLADSLEHERPNGDSWSTVITEDLKLPIKYMGENLARLKSSNPKREHLTAHEWFTIWKESPPHYELMLSEEFTHMGIGIYYEYIDDAYHAYATTHFAKIDE